MDHICNGCKDMKTCQIIMTGRYVKYYNNTAVSYIFDKSKPTVGKLLDCILGVEITKDINFITVDLGDGSGIKCDVNTLDEIRNSTLVNRYPYYFDVVPVEVDGEIK